MKGLRTLWDASLALCLLAALVLLVLVGARLAATRFDRKRAAARARLLPRLLDGDPAQLEPAKGIERGVAAVLTIELAEMTRGTERDVLLARAFALGVTAYFAGRMRSWSAQARLTAVEALAMFEQCREQAVRALDDRNPDVRLGAALALAQHGEAPAPLTILSKLKADEGENSLLLVSLVTDLAERDPGVVAGLLNEKELSYRIKVAAMDALAERGGDYAAMLASIAREYIVHPDLQPRLFRILGRTGHPAVAEAIIEGMASDNWTVRSSAAEAAGKAGVTQAADILGKLLDDTNYWVRYRASEALLRLGPRGVAVLREASGSDDALVASTAAKMLRESRAA